MIPILYASTETEFQTNGLGMLVDAIDVTVEEELNGLFELTMVYPVSGRLFAQIQQRSIILAESDPVRQAQPFRVYRITKPMNGRVQVYARHLAYDLQGIPVQPFSVSGAALALQSLKDYAATDCPFDFYTDKSATGTMTVAVPTAIWSQLGGRSGSVLDVFGGEYLFDRYTISLLTRRGTDNGVSIRYGKNLTDLQQDENCANCYTGVYPYWTNTDGKLVELPERIVDASGTYGYVRVLPLDLSEEWEEAPAEEQLHARAERYMADNNIGIPDVSWTVSFIQLEQTEEYKGMALLERVQLGDTLSVEFSAMGVSATARAVAIRYKPLMNRYDKVTLGKVKSNLAQTIVSQSKEIAEKTSTNAILKASEGAMAALLGTKGGCIRQLDTDNDGMSDTLYIADNPDPAQAKYIWRWNYMGWAGSKNGYNGPFTAAATLEQGLLADFVTAANLIAGSIKSSNGSFALDLNSGEIKILAMDDLGDQIADVNDDLQGKFNTIAKHISFVGGVTISSDNNVITLQLDNEAGIVFRKNGEQFGLWDGENFYTGNIIIGVNERAQFGAFAFVPRSDGSLSLLKVGG